MTTVPEGVGVGPGNSDPAAVLPAWRLVDLQATIENLSAAVVVTGLDGRLWYANRRAESEFGWIAGRLVGSRVGDISGVEVSDETAREIAEALRAGRSWNGEFELRRPDGSSVTAEVSDSGLYDASGTLVGVVSIVTDITEARRSMEALVTETAALRFLLDAATVVSSALGFEECVRSLGALAVPLLGDVCLIDVVADGSVHRMAAIHADPAKAGLTERLVRYPPMLSSTHPAADILRSGGRAVAGEMDDEFLRETTLDDEHFRIVRELEFRSYMCAPLRARGRTVGAVTLVSAGSGRDFGPSDLALIEDLATRVAHVVDNARLYSEQARVARSLQAALLPRAIPATPGLQVAVAYQAAGEGNEVGGDFYDVFEVGRGAWAIAIGDVCGRGPDAAAVTGLVRHALHASGRNRPNPKGMLQLANAMVWEEEGRSVERFCTAACAVVRPGEPVRLSYAGAGHPPVIVRRADGSTKLLRAEGVALGILAESSGRNQRLSLDVGDLVVMYTDGLTEARDASGAFYGEARLLEVLGGAEARGAQELLDAVVDDLRRFGGGKLGDDLAMVVFGPEP